MVLAALLLSPIAGLLAGYLTHAAARRLLRRATPRANRPIKLLQIAGTAFMAFSHGANDAQKSMGVGASERPRGVRWNKAREFAWTRLLTVPGSAATAVVLWYVSSPLLP